ncbi:MAG: biopolymer transporter ExbD [Pseudobdellovibrionaceae bacterium]|nr:biopolymer transporter ExbD [Bdellovibrionales bacterium]USN47431.1 MAG: biopolymer transporter ExbD [Pseudobdellovibrionaceae bacterium]
MPIHVPGVRNRRGRAAGAKRSVVAVLSLTAMVDLFTVLVVFLLQNYNVTGQALEIPKGVELPSAQEVKELKPANVVIVGEDFVRLNNEVIIPVADVKRQTAWEIDKLIARLKELIEKGKKEDQSVATKLRDAVKRKSEKEGEEEELPEYRKITIQADKEIDFLSIKKLMYSATQAGIYEINFAVMKRAGEKDAS